MSKALGKPTILVLVRYYLPGFKAGGPLRSIAGLVGALAGDYEFKIICLDRDIGDDRPFADEPVSRWYEFRSTRVLRVPPGPGGTLLILKALRHEQYNVLYLNSVWDRSFSIMPLLCRKLRLLPSVPLVLAPRGEFSAGAIGIKHWRKTIYLAVAAAARLFKRVLWQASSEYEEQDIVHYLGDVDLEQAPVVVAQVQPPPQAPSPGLNVCVAPDLQGDRHPLTTVSRARVKETGKLRIVTHGRVCKKKNIEYGLRLLKNIAGEVQYDIYGPLEDAKYVALCEQQRASLPENVTVRFMGPVLHEVAVNRLEAYHLFLFPTLGENFGHVIVEALQAGCVPLISNTTPWRNLQDADAGWDLPLDRPDLFVDAVQTAVSWTDQQFQTIAQNARAFLAGHQLVRDAIDRNRHLFRSALTTHKRKKAELLYETKA